LLSQLTNLSSSAFSLQQLLFNLDDAVAQAKPTFQGVDDDGVAFLLEKPSISIWGSIAKKQGLPLVGVTAVAPNQNNSSLQLTALERSVSPVVDALTGTRLCNPSDVQVLTP